MNQQEQTIKILEQLIEDIKEDRVLDLTFGVDNLVDRISYDDITMSYKSTGYTKYNVSFIIRTK